MTLKPICVNCNLFFRPLRNGVIFSEGMPKPGVPLAHAGRNEDWQPYKIWSGDKWQCKGCGAQIIVGVGRNPISVHHESGFDRIQRLAELQVNDC